MIKKILMFFCIAGFVLVLNSCTPTSEEDYDLGRINVDENGWKGISFTTDFFRRNATIIGIEAGGFFQDILILPTTFQGIPITRIAANAFRNPSHADPNHRIVGINQLDLSYMYYLEYIGESAFRGSIRCRNIPNIETITFGNIPSLREIGNFAFADNNLHDMFFVNLPEIRLIGNSAFENTEIVRIKFSQLPNLEYIGSRAFHGRVWHVTDLDLKNLPSLKEIGDEAFSSIMLSVINLYNLPLLERIGVYAFRTSGMLNKLQMSNLPSLRRIEHGAFLVSAHPSNPAVGISNLNIDLSLSKRLEHIGNRAFGLVDVTDEIRERYINN